MVNREWEMRKLRKKYPLVNRKDLEGMLDRKESRIKAQTLPQAGIRKGNTAIDLQKVEVPTGDMFNTDDFNKYMGVVSTLNKTKFYKDKVDDYYTLNRQNMDIEMMNSGSAPKKPINPKTGKPFETMERYNARQELKKGMLRAQLEEQGGKSFIDEMKLRRAEDSPYPGDIVDAKLEPGEYVLNRNAVKAIGEDKLNEINNKLKPRFSDRIRKKGRDMAHNFQVGANRKLWEEYLQKGGAVKHYALGDLVTAGKDLKEKFGASSKDFLNKAASRYGGDAWKASKAMDIQRGATDHEGNPISPEQAKTMRDDYGLGKGNFSQAFGQAGQSLKEDIGTATSAGLGALKNTWDNRNEGEASDYADVWSGKEKGSLMQRGKKGLGMLGMMMQDASQAQGFKGADWKGSGFGLGKHSGPNTKDANDEAKKLTDIKAEDEYSSASGIEAEYKKNLIDDLDIEEGFDPTQLKAEMDNMFNEEFSGEEGERTGNNPIGPDGAATVTNASGFGDIPQPIPSSSVVPGQKVNPSDDNVQQGINETLNMQGSSMAKRHGNQTYYHQEGGPVTLEGFIQQSWRNMR